MRLAPDEIAINVGRERIVLHPTLRAAYRLERQFGGLDALARAVLAGNLGALVAVIREGARRDDAADYLEAFDHGRLQKILDEAVGPILEFIAVLIGFDPDSEPTPPRSPGKAAKPGEVYMQLFSIATGVLGWTPEDAWNAEPAEIIAAHKGRVEFVGDILKAIFGSPDNADEPIPGPDHSTLDRDGLQALAGLLTRS